MEILILVTIIAATFCVLSDKVNVTITFSNGPAACLQSDGHRGSGASAEDRIPVQVSHMRRKSVRSWSSGARFRLDSVHVVLQANVLVA